MTHKVGLASVLCVQYPIHDTQSWVGGVCSIPYKTHKVGLASVLCLQYPIHDTAGLVGVSGVCAVSHT